MARVSSKHVIIVTHGKPENRSHRFQKAFSPEAWDEQVVNCELSIETQLINIARSKYPDRSLASIMKDSTCLAEVMRELVQYLKSKNSTTDSSLRQTNCFLYFYTRLVE